MNALRSTAKSSSSRSLLQATGELPGRALLLLIHVYQRTISPLLPVVSLGSCGCRFTPTCSHYAAEAIHRHGAIHGTALALARLLKCTPLHPGGIDPVPATRATRPARPPICRSARQA